MSNSRAIILMSYEKYSGFDGQAYGICKESYVVDFTLLEWVIHFG